MLTATEGKIQAKVRDQGNGFDPQATADPTSVENLLCDSGRGLLLMRAFVDELAIRRRRSACHPSAARQWRRRAIPTANHCGADTPR